MSQNLTKGSKISARIRDRRKEKERKITKVALELFSKRGFERTTMEELAARLNISKGLLYFYFNSKEEILLRIIEEAYFPLVEKLNSLLNERIDPHKKLLKFIEIEVDFYKENRELHPLLTSILKGFGLKEMSESFQDRFKEIHMKEVEILELILKEGEKRKIFKKIDTKVLAYSLGGIFHELLKMFLDEGRELEELKDIIREIYLFGVRR